VFLLCKRIGYKNNDYNANYNMIVILSENLFLYLNIVYITACKLFVIQTL
jgi:hypothetical protein